MRPAPVASPLRRSGPCGFSLAGTAGGRCTSPPGAAAPTIPPLWRGKPLGTFPAGSCDPPTRRGGPQLSRQPDELEDDEREE